MNGYDLSYYINYIRTISNNKSLDLLFLYDSDLLIIDYEKYINQFSLSNLKKLLSVVKKERLKINEIVIKW